MPENTLRDRLKDVISFFLAEQKMFGADDAYESSCKLADDIFDEFNVDPKDQDLKGFLVARNWGF